MCTAAVELGSNDRPRPAAQATPSDDEPAASPSKRPSADFSDPYSDTSEVTPVSGDDRALPPPRRMAPAPDAAGAPGAVAAATSGASEACNGYAAGGPGRDEAVWALGVEPSGRVPAGPIVEKNPMQLPPALDRVDTLQAALESGRRRPVFFLDYGASSLWGGVR